MKVGTEIAVFLSTRGTTHRGLPHGFYVATYVENKYPHHNPYHIVLLHNSLLDAS